MNKLEIQRRLILLTDNIDVLVFSHELFQKRQHIKDQLERSSTSAACHYGEVIAAESTKDFVHKLSVVEKELRECHSLLFRLSLRLIKGNEIHELLDETDQLIRILYSSKKTAQENI